MLLKLKHLPTLPSLLAGPQTPLIHRDLSWLQFNERVLSEARSSSQNPLFERVKFLAISQSNLDEFFMIRFASLNRSIQKMKKGKTPALRHMQDVRANILENIAEFGAKQIDALDQLIPELDAARIHIVRRVRESKRSLALGKKLFEEKIFPNLRPPETFRYAKLSELDNLQMGLVFPEGKWYPIPKNLPLVLQGEEAGAVHFFFLDDLLLTFLGAAFREDGPPGIVRITRDSDVTADLEEEEDPESIPDIVRTRLGSRERGTPVRLQYRGEVGADFHLRAMKALKLDSMQLFPAPGSLCLGGLWNVVKNTPESLLTKQGLNYPPLQPRVPKPFHSNAIFAKLKKHDYLLHHPYDSFDAFVEWMKTVAKDKHVASIEQTIYRTDEGSPLIKVLKDAASRKRVRVIIELRARFDELNNLRLADELRKAGVEVSFGFGALKLHAKITLVTRHEEGGSILYTHLSTGNYNATTARQYTDLSILTANPAIGADARLFFDSVWKGKVPAGFKQLVLAPTQLHRKLLNSINAETRAAREGKPARIVAKVNALVDETVIGALYAASKVGVKVDLIVRGACSLIPGITTLSRNIRVISVVDRFLEHSRIYYFESQKAMYLSSADWMPRNFYSRLEIAFPILDPKIFAFIEKVLIPTYLGDNQKARELSQQGTWRKRPATYGNPSVRAQFVFERLAFEEYFGTPLGEELPTKA